MSIVKEIHASFSEAQDKIVAEVKRILNNDEESTKRLASLGFTSAKNTKVLDPVEKKKMEELIELQSKYTEIAPFYKFITEERRLEICKKYGILMAPVEAFIGEIPQKNVEAIVNFKIADNSYLTNVEDTDIWVTKDEKRMPISQIGSEHLYNIIKYFMFRSVKPTQYQRVINEYAKRIPHDLIKLNSTERKGTDFTHCFYIGGTRIDATVVPKDYMGNVVNPKMYIVSDIAQLNIKDYALDADKMFLSRDLKLQQEAEEKLRLLREEDPIVLVSVKGGYLVVTAWGAEAEEARDLYN